MEKKFMYGLWAGVYVGTMCAIVYIYKKNMDKENAQYVSYMDSIVLPWKKEDHGDAEKKIEE